MCISIFIGILPETWYFVSVFLGNFWGINPYFVSVFSKTAPVSIFFLGILPETRYQYQSAGIKNSSCPGGNLSDACSLSVLIQRNGNSGTQGECGEHICISSTLLINLYQSSSRAFVEFHKN